MTCKEYMENKGLRVGDRVFVIDPCSNEGHKPKPLFLKIIDVGRSYVYLEGVKPNETYCTYPKNNLLWLRYFNKKNPRGIYSFGD